MNRFYKPVISMMFISVVLTSAATVAMAGTFKRTKVMDLKYAWGTTSIAEFDSYDMAYPGYFPIAELTFESDGTFSVLDTATGGSGAGIYDKRGRNLEVTIVTPSYGAVVQYVGTRVGRGVFEGEILVDGIVRGHWRGSF